jgi:hypothetical protein
VAAAAARGLWTPGDGASHARGISMWRPPLGRGIGGAFELLTATPGLRWLLSHPRFEAHFRWAGVGRATSMHPAQSGCTPGQPEIHRVDPESRSTLRKLRILF